MAALNGNDIPGLLGMDVFIVKLLGCVLSRVATLAVGVEGPMVHLGACVASVACRAEQGALCWLMCMPTAGAGTAVPSCWLAHRPADSRRGAPPPPCPCRVLGLGTDQT